MALLIGRPFTEGAGICNRNRLLATDVIASNYIGVIHVILFTPVAKTLEAVIT